MVMAAKITRLIHKIAIQLHLVSMSCTICSSRSRRPVRKLLDTPSYISECRPKKVYPQILTTHPVDTMSSNNRVNYFLSSATDSYLIDQGLFHYYRSQKYEKTASHNTCCWITSQEQNTLDFEIQNIDIHSLYARRTLSTGLWNICSRFRTEVVSICRVAVKTSTTTSKRCG